MLTAGRAVLTAGRKEAEIFRPWLEPRLSAWSIATILFLLHAVLRFGGLSDPRLYPLSMAIIWPLPWLLASRQGRRRMGLRAPVAGRWYWIGPVVAVGLLAACAACAWLVHGAADGNWFVQHALAMREALDRAPAAASTVTLFAIVTLPAMIFSPLGEEFLYRGFLLTAFTDRWGARTALHVQAGAFALAHLAHYGLAPLQPGLLVVWLPSMYFAALAFGWLVRSGRSLWPAVLGHAVFNLGMNAIVFLALPSAMELTT